MKAAIAIFLLSAAIATCQTQTAPADKSKRPSPPATASCRFADGSTITVDYSQPSMRGRKIYGGLVPYGKVWRTGANEATTFVPTADVEVGGTAVSKGNYTLFTLPSEGTWKLIINKQTGQSGTQYDEKQDLTGIDMKSEPLPSPVEKFTIAFDQSGPKTCTMRLDWENTRQSIEIKEK